MAASKKKDISRIAKFIDKRVTELASIKSQQDIAREAGYDQANMISMLKTGVAKVPIDRVEKLAKALDADPAYMFRLALEQYFDMTAIARLAPGLSHTPTRNEQEILDLVRGLSGDEDPVVTEKLKKKLREAFA